MPKLRTALKMPLVEHIAMAEAIVLLAWARFLVVFVPLRHWRRHISDRPSEHSQMQPLTEAERETANLVGRAIRRAVRNVPVELICLPQALAARWMLQRRGIDTQFYIGTRRDGEEGDRFHAWLKARDHWVSGHCNEAKYVVFARPRKV